MTPNINEMEQLDYNNTYLYEWLYGISEDDEFDFVTEARTINQIYNEYREECISGYYGES